MDKYKKRLLEIQSELDSFLNDKDLETISREIDEYETEAWKLNPAWSGSWMGYHSRVYYKDFNSPPPLHGFSPEWGLMLTETDDWIEYQSIVVIDYIKKQSNNPNIQLATDLNQKALDLFDQSLTGLKSLITAKLNGSQDRFIENVITKIENTQLKAGTKFIQDRMPTTNISRDTRALLQGVGLPPHLSVIGFCMDFKSAISGNAQLMKAISQIESHLDLLGNGLQQKIPTQGSTIFIGHGRSHLWRELKDFLQDRLSLDWEEFNRFPTAGIPTTARLSEMLDRSIFALLIMTAEDEQPDGKLRARMNVIHEAGLFQGRLGFTKAIVCLEDGCEEFSNIYGLGQIRFPKGNISACFEEVRQVLEREGILSSNE